MNLLTDATPSSYIQSGANSQIQRAIEAKAHAPARVNTSPQNKSFLSPARDFQDISWP
jgi:hypothetical protein